MKEINCLGCKQPIPLTKADIKKGKHIHHWHKPCIKAQKRAKWMKRLDAKKKLSLEHDMMLQFGTLSKEIGKPKMFFVA